MARAGIKAECKTIKHEDGSQDVVVKVPLIQLKSQVTETQWKEVLKKLIEKKYRQVREKIMSDPDKSDEEKKDDWDSFVVATIKNADEKADLKIDEKYTIRAKTREDACNRAYRIAEKYGAHLFIPTEEE